MATAIGTNNLTLADWAKRRDPNGKTATIVEILNEQNEVLDDMVVKEANLPTGHRTTIRSGLPSATWRKLNFGVQPDKSTTVQVTDSIGSLQAYSDVDKDLADLEDDVDAFRASEDRAFIEGMTQDMASTLFYGDTDVDPEKFMGLDQRYNDLSAGNAANIIDAGGTGSDNASVWLINWGDNRVHATFPKGSNVVGLDHVNKGQVTLQDTQTPPGNYEGYRSHYKWNMGLVVRDWRYIVRIANIDVSDLAADMATGADLPDVFVQALEQIQSTAGKPVFYCNKTVRAMLRRQIRKVSNVNLTFENQAGRRVGFFDEIPVRIVDKLTNTEAQIT